MCGPHRPSRLSSSLPADLEQSRLSPRLTRRSSTLLLAPRAPCSLPSFADSLNCCLFGTVPAYGCLACARSALSCLVLIMARLPSPLTFLSPCSACSACFLFLVPRPLANGLPSFGSPAIAVLFRITRKSYVGMDGLMRRGQYRLRGLRLHWSNRSWPRPRWLS